MEEKPIKDKLIKEKTRKDKQINEKSVEEGNKVAVLFPGIGYTCKRPLLYYTGSLAQEKGYQLIRLDYGDDIHTMSCRDSKSLEKVADLALERVWEKLAGIWNASEILFISKSVGTLIAARIEERADHKVRHFMMTPIPATIPYLSKMDGEFVAGTGDPYISAALVQKAADDYPDKAAYIFEDCNHSLEKAGHTGENLQNLCKTVKILDQMLGKEGTLH